MPDSQAQLSRLLDEASIRNVTWHFADAAMRGDQAAFQALFTEDGEFTIVDTPLVQAKVLSQIGITLGKVSEGQDFFVQLAQPGVIEIDGDEAIARCLCYEAARGPGEHYYRNIGMFFDRLRRSGDGWLFAKRTFHYFWLDVSPYSGDSFSQLAAFAKSGG
jgi:ketosteroid isomerase-like protein